MITNKMKSIAYYKGVNAAKTNRPISSNPYQKINLQLWWDKGYLDQKENLITEFKSDDT